MWSKLYLTLFLFLILGASLASAYPVYLRPTLGGNIQPDTSIDYSFNFTIDSGCSNVVLSQSSTITTDSYGIGFVDLDVSGITSIPSYLCEYREGSLRKVHTLSDQLFRNIYASSVNLTNNITADWINAKINHSNIQNEPTYLTTESDPIFISENTTLWNAINNRLELTDQRFNETTWILSQGYITTDTNRSDADILSVASVYNDTDWVNSQGFLTSFSDNSINIAGENITSGTIGIDFLPDLTNAFTLDILNITNFLYNYNQTIPAIDYVDAQGFLTSIADNSTRIVYQNITNIPTCGAGEHLYFDGTTLSCTADEGGINYTNLALTNQSNSFGAFNQSFNTNTLFIDSGNGRVGIGTTSPDSTLDVNGPIWTQGALNTDHIRIRPAGATYLSLVPYSDDGMHWSMREVNGPNNNLIFTAWGNRAKDHDHDTLSSNPTIFIHSITDPDTANTEWGSFSFEGTGSGGGYFNIANGVGDIVLQPTGNVGIGTASPTYPLTVSGNVSGISIWSDGNISASGYITRTSIFDKSKGSALDLIHDSDYYLTDGKIDHTKFYGYAGEFPTTDYSKPHEEQYQEEECDDKGVCSNVIKTSITYPETKMVGGVDLGSEIDVLRQSIYELKQENDLLKSELCKKDTTYIWCVGVIK